MTARVHAGLRWAALAAAALLPSAQAQEAVVELTVTRADTLIGLSRQVLVKPQAWREVAMLNKLRDPNRINPGQVLRIPQRLMRSSPTPARLVSVVGDVRVDGAAGVLGSEVNEGQKLQTSEGASAVLAMADGSRLRVPPSSLAEVAASRTYGGRGAAPGLEAGTDGWFAGALRVLRGSVEVFATKVLRAKPLEVITPTAVVGVRGTQFRVGFDEGANAGTRLEVVEGVVRLDAGNQTPGVELRAGFGAVNDASRAAPRVARLLEAPDLAAVPELFERPLVRFKPAAPTDVLRVQVAEDSAFDRIVSDQRVPAGTDVRIAGLDDARWYLRARRIDEQGIEGFDATRAFVLKARPEPPAYRSPRADAKQSIGAVEFAWASNVEAPRARLQVARDAAFNTVLLERENLTDASLSAPFDAAGVYHWRLASVRPNGERGPYGDAQRFELRPLPEPPKGGLAADGKTLVFSWGARPEDRQQVQLARDEAFTEVVAQADLTSAEWVLPTPGRGGSYFFRYRSVEPDGFTSPYSSTLSIELPRDWSPLWLLLPMLFAL
ncbi:MAG: FecR domain-containing protein [Burkholderiales bacterium]|nr:FecR domain-containing protein [Burkholderiales bacterium]